MRTAPRASLALLATVVACLLLAAPASAHGGDDDGDHEGHHVVHPGESIQAAIDAASPGDTIDVRAGVYHENLTIVGKDGITLRGARRDDDDDEDTGEGGTILMPAATPTPSICNSPEGDGVNGICVVGEFGPVPGAPGRPIHDVTIKSFTIDGFSGFGVLAVLADDFTVRHTEARNNAAYGISGFVLSGVRFEHNVANDNGEPGLYIGDSPDADARVVGNVMLRNGIGGEGIGILIRDSSSGVIKHNRASGNCVGIVFVDTGENPIPVSDWTAKRNHVSENNAACPASAEPGGPPAFSGTGILLGGTHDVTVTRNRVFDNVPTLDSPFSGGIVVASTTALGGADPTDNVVKRNRARGNQPADLVWDGTGTGNVFKRNRCSTSTPAGLCD